MRPTWSGCLLFATTLVIVTHKGPQATYHEENEQEDTDWLAYFTG